MRTACNKLFKQFAWGFKEKILTTSNISYSIDQKEDPILVTNNRPYMIKTGPSTMTIELSLVVTGDDNVKRVTTILQDAFEAMNKHA